jgi:hypothetical protein
VAVANLVGRGGHVKVEAFVVLGLGLQLMTLAIIFTVFKKRGWF